MDLDISTEFIGDACRISIKGEVDVYTSPSLKSAIIGVIDQGCLNLVVDLEDVGFIDSSGLGVLVSGLRRVKEQSGSLRLICARENLLKIFRITGLDKVFPIFANAGEALSF